MLKRRHKRHPLEGPWIIFEGGGKRIYRRRKTKAERFEDVAHKKLSDWGKEITREYIREAMFGPQKSTIDHGYQKWIDIDQNGTR